LVPLSCDLLRGAEAEGVVFGGFGVEFWVEVDCFDGCYDRDPRGDVGVVCEGDAFGVMDL
jgi:hypothetical protein